MVLQKRNIWKRILKWIGLFILVIFFLLIVVWLALQTQWGQNFVKNQAVNYLQKKLHTKVSIGNIRTDWFNHFEIKDFYIEDQQKKILVSAHMLEFKHDLSDILRKKITVTDIAIDKAEINLYRARNVAGIKLKLKRELFAL